MKNLKLLILPLILISGMIACKKEKNTPSTNTTNPPVVTITNTETSLLGKWYIQKIETRNSSNILTNTDTSGHQYGDNTIFQSSQSPTTGYLNCIVTYVGNTSTLHWKASNDTIVPSSGVVNRILTLNGTDLIYTSPVDTTHGGIRYYYKK